MVFMLSSWVVLEEGQAFSLAGLSLLCVEPSFADLVEGGLVVNAVALVPIGKGKPARPCFPNAPATRMKSHDCFFIDRCIIGLFINCTCVVIISTQSSD